MGATGYIIKSVDGAEGEEQKQVVVSPADGTIDVERVESDNEVDFKIKTTYDGYETIDTGSPYSGGYFRAIHIKFNEENRRYRLVCILNGGSYTPVARDFAFYYIKFGWRTGGVNADHWYIEEFSRQGNGAFVALEQIALNEYNVLIHTPTGYAYANIGILKEDKEPDVTIEHFNPQTTRYTPTGTIITTEIPNWRNGSPAVWQIISDIQNPVIGQLGHYYAADRNLYFYDGYNWHNVYSLAQGVASMLATTDAPATANNGTIYYDTTEGNLKIWFNGGWKDMMLVIENSLGCIYVNSAAEYNYTPKEGYLRAIGNRVIQIFQNGSWNTAWAQAVSVNFRNYNWSGSNGQIGIVNSINRFAFYNGGHHYLLETTDIEPAVVTFTNYSGETIAAEDRPQIIVTAAFGANSILDLTDIEKQEGKTIEITNISGNTFKVKDGASVVDLNGGNESVIKAVCLSSTWRYFKVGTITEFT